MNTERGSDQRNDLGRLPAPPPNAPPPLPNSGPARPDSYPPLQLPSAPQATDIGYPGFAGWGERFVAFVLDSLPVLAIYGGVAGLLYWVSERHDNDAGWPPLPEVWPRGIAIPIIAAILLITYLVWNFGVRQGKTGSTWGKRVVGIGVVDGRTGQPVGAGRSIGRQILHGLDSAPCYFGFLMPLWDDQNRTFADAIAKTVVVKIPPERRTQQRSWSAQQRLIAAGVTVVLVVGLAVGSFFTYFNRPSVPSPPVAEICALMIPVLDQAGFTKDNCGGGHKDPRWVNRSAFPHTHVSDDELPYLTIGVHAESFTTKADSSWTVNGRPATVRQYKYMGGCSISWEREWGRAEVVAFGGQSTDSSTRAPVSCGTVLQVADYVDSQLRKQH